MEDSDLSSCSFVSENEESQEEINSNQVDIQKLNLQIEREQEINQQLQKTLENCKKQLKDALDAVSQSGAVKEQISLLQRQLSEANDKNEKLTDELRSLQQSGSATVQQEEQIKGLTKDLESALSNVKKLSDQNSRLRQENKSINAKTLEQEQLLETCSEELEKAQEQKKKLRQKNSNLVKAVNTIREQCSNMSTENQKALNEQAALKQEIDSLKIQLETSNQETVDAQSTIETLHKELEAKCTVISALEYQLESQREEIGDMASEKQNIIALLQRMNSILSASEIKIDTLKKENAFLQQKQAQKDQRQSSFSKSEIVDLKIPFDGDLSTDCEKILKLPQYQPIQRIQLILNEAAKYINDADAEVKAIKKTNSDLISQREESDKKAEQYIEILDSLVTDLKSVALTEKVIQKSSPLKADKAFIALAATKCSEIDNVLRDKAMAEPHFISNDFFFTEDITKRKREIQSIADVNDATFAIFASLFLINDELRKQVDHLRAIQENAQSSHTPLPSAEQSAENVNGNTTQEAVELLMESPERVARLRRQFKQATQALKRSQAEQMELNRADSELRTRLSSLELENESLKSENEVIAARLQVAESRLAVHEEDLSTSQMALQAKEGCEERRRSLEGRLRESLKESGERGERIEALQRELQKQKEDGERALKRERSKAKKQQEEALGQIQFLNEALEAMEGEKGRLKKALRNMKRSHREEAKAAAAAAEAALESERSTQKETIEQLRAKGNAAAEMSQKLVQQVAEAEQTAAAAAAERDGILARLKAAQQELSQLKQSSVKERQTLQGQIGAQAMVYEAKIAKAQKEATEEAQKSVAALLAVAAETVGAHYGVDECELAGDGFKALLTTVKSDLDKLKYFQEESTKFTPN